MSETAEKALIPARELTPSQRDECLLVLARRGGNTRRASEELKRRGYDVSHAGLVLWKNDLHAERYIELASGLSRKEAEEGIAQAFRESVIESQELAAKVRERLGDHIDDLDPKDLPKAHRELQLASGISFDKYYATQDRPTQIVEVRNPDYYAKVLAASLEDLGLAVNATAEEILDAEEVSGDDPQLPAGPAI